MSNPLTEADLPRLQEEGVKLAIALQARDALHGYLKLWSGFATVIVGAAALFGWSLNSQVSGLKTEISTFQKEAKEAEDHVVRQQKAVDERLKDLEKVEARLDQKAISVDAYAGHLAATARDLDDRSSEAFKRIDDAANQSTQSAGNARKSAELAQQRLEDASSQATNAKNIVDSIKASKDQIDEVSDHAHVIDEDLSRHREVFRNALLDYVTLRGNEDSPEIMLTTPNPDVYYKVCFHTPQKIYKDRGFTLSYDVTTCKGERTESGVTCREAIHMTHGDKLIRFEGNRRDWHQIDGTDDQYQFAVDYVFSSAVARNFVTIRVGATDKLLPVKNEPHSEIARRKP
jgi:hypothetical protein